MLIRTLFVIAVVMASILTTCAYLIYVERKLSAWIQNRKGPNRVGPFGLLQPLADGLKFLLKEDIIPSGVDKLLFVLAPAISVMTTLMAFAVVPFGPTSPDPDQPQFIIAPGVDVGIVFIFAVTSLAVYAVILGGWASNNKYSMLGGLRASAQVISYEIPLGMSILGIVLLTGSLNLESILHDQAMTEGLWGIFRWNIWVQPVGALLFFTSALAESNRLPFDLPESEQELVGGYHTEYSALKFGMFFLGEYTHVITISFLTSILFFGGWHFPYVAEADSVGWWSAFLKLSVLLSKVLLCIVFIMMLRWSLPRFRFDQLMGLAWKVLVPLGLVNLVLVMVVLQTGLPTIVLSIGSIAMFVCVAGLGASTPTGRIVRAARLVGHPTTSLYQTGIDEPSVSLS